MLDIILDAAAAGTKETGDETTMSGEEAIEREDMMMIGGGIDGEAGVRRVTTSRAGQRGAAMMMTVEEARTDGGTVSDYLDMHEAIHTECASAAR